MIDIFPIALLISIILIFIEKFQKKFFFKVEKSQPQNLHKKSVSRFGGVALFLSLMIVSYYDQNPSYEFLRNLLLCSSLAFFIGLIDDFGIILPPLTRLTILLIPSFFAYYFLKTEAYNLDIPYVDILFENQIFSIVFICIALSGIANAFNMIDGVNGLVLTYVLTICVITVLFSKNYFNFETNLIFVALFFSCLGVYILNFPFGRIFLGDGGSYFIGMIISITIIKHYQDNELSPWYVLCVLIYPVTEAIATISRRIFERSSAVEADNRHLHHMFYKRLKKTNIKSERMLHFMTSLFLFVLYTPFLVGANTNPKDTTFLVYLCLTFVSFYVLLYVLLAPKNLKLFK